MCDRAAAIGTGQATRGTQMKITNVIARVLAGSAWLLLAGAGAGYAQSPGYPDRTVKVIVPFAAGGPHRRGGAPHHPEALGEARPTILHREHGGSRRQSSGMGAVARAPADGYTILFASSSYNVNPSLYARSPYNPDKDFAPVTKAGGLPQRAVRESQHSRKDGEGADRSAQGQSRQVHLRLARHRHHAAPVERIVQS